MSTFVKKSAKYIIVLAIVITVTVSTTITAFMVDAASESQKTETDNKQAYILDKEDTRSRAVTIDEAKKKAQDVIKELSLKAAQKDDEEEETVTEPVIVYEPQADSEPESSQSSTTTGADDNSYVSASVGSGYLLDIPKADSSYTSYAISLSDKDRDLAERIVMGEAGSCGYTGMALVAQCLRDAFVRGGYSNIKDVINAYGYYGSTSITPSSTCKEVINYIFDQGGSAVQHRVLSFYAPKYCSSPWHESQNFICEYAGVKFFDLY